MFNDWLKLLKGLSKSNYSTKSFICPECGRKSVEYVYVGNPITHIGYLPIWCTNCNRGIQISRVEIPKEAKMIEFSDLDSIKNMIPDFKQVIPGE